MSEYFTEKYGGAAGKILDTWGRNPLNKEMGDIYEEDVHGQPSYDVEAALCEYNAMSTGGRIDYRRDLAKAKERGIIQG